MEPKLQGVLVHKMLKCTGYYKDRTDIIFTTTDCFIIMLYSYQLKLRYIATIMAAQFRQLW